MTFAHDDQSPESAAPATPFHRLADYVALPRLSGLVMSPDGSRLAVGVSTPNPKNTKYQKALWSIDPVGTEPARRLTTGATGESLAAFTRANDLLFAAKRVDPQSDAPDEDGVPLWRLPAVGGEAELVAYRRGGFDSLTPARAADVIVTGTAVLPGVDLAGDDEARQKRKEAGVSAILHSGYPIRYWDHDLGPDEAHLAVTELPAGSAAAGERTPTATLRDLTPDAGRALLVECAHDVAQDGTFVVTAWTAFGPGADSRTELHRIDVASGRRERLLADRNAYLSGPVISPDGRWATFVSETLGSGTTAPQVELRLLELASNRVTTLGGQWDRWPAAVVWRSDNSGLFAVADDNGRAPVWRVPLDGSDAMRLTTGDDSYSDLSVHPDGRTLFALRTSYLAPPHAVRIDTETGTVTELRGPAATPTLPGRLTEVTASGVDGTTVRAWLALPHEADAARPAPLLLWVHGGPLSSWNAWSWRWNPWLMVAAGYAVLLPDPALSTGYGQSFIQRGWGAWGDAAYTDSMAITDAAEQRADIDATRTAAMGGSFGGYMANWIAGHTNRFRAIVSHASLWALEDFGGSTDGGNYWDREMTPEMMAANSPHLHAEKIRTPMLVVHGDKDYRVPIGQGQRLWYDLLAKSALPADENGVTVHRLLYFPSENHWVLTPQHAEIWYRVVLDFLAQHVLGADEAPLPRLLGGPVA